MGGGEIAAHIFETGAEMSAIVKTNDFTAALGECIRTNVKFRCSRSYADLSVWMRLCTRLSDSEIFSVLPVAMHNVWTDQSLASLLKARGAHKSDRFNMQNLAANLVCFRRTEIQNGEVHLLQTQLAHLSHEFNNLSGNVFEILIRLDRLEAENSTLKQVLCDKGLIDPAVFKPEQVAKGVETHLSVRPEQDAVTKYVL